MLIFLHKLKNQSKIKGVKTKIWKINDEFRNLTIICRISKFLSFFLKFFGHTTLISIWSPAYLCFSIFWPNTLNFGRKSLLANTFFLGIFAFGHIILHFENTDLLEYNYSSWYFGNFALAKWHFPRLKLCFGHIFDTKQRKIHDGLWSILTV